MRNRVTPFGEIVALPGRGTLLGNRGVLVNDAREIVRPFQLKRWIACRLQWKGIRRALAQPRRWTELFFLDEASAYSAGHRPCAECRRDDFNRFRAAWVACFGAIRSIDEVDAQLHRERNNGGRKRTYRANLASLPDGAFVADGGAAWLVRGDTLYEWCDMAYRARKPRGRGDVDVLTPPSIVHLFASHPELLGFTEAPCSS